MELVFIHGNPFAKIQYGGHVAQIASDESFGFRNGGEFRVSKTHFADRYDGGESMMQLAQRIYNLLDELKADTGKTYLLVAHNGIARVVHSYFYDMTNEEYAAAGIKNCQLVEYTFE